MDRGILEQKRRTIVDSDEQIDGTMVIKVTACIILATPLWKNAASGPVTIPFNYASLLL